MALPQAAAPPGPAAQAAQYPEPVPAPDARPRFTPTGQPAFTPAKVLRPTFTPVPAREEARQATGPCIAGAHGGAGTSTIAALLREVLNEGGQAVPVSEVPALPDGDPRRIAAGSGLAQQAQGRVLVITARSTGEGTRRAVVAVTVAGLLGLRPPVLAVTSDGAGPVPPAAAQRLAQLEAEQRVAAIVRIPFSAAIRAGVTGGRTDKKLRRAVLALAGAVRDAQDGGRS